MSGAAITVEDVNAFVARAFPAAAKGGVHCESLGERCATVRWTYRADELRPGGFISGPRLFGVADCALWFATFTVLGIEAMALTSEMSIRFLRPAEGGDLMATATLNAVAGRRLVGTVDLWIDGSPERIVATAQGTYVRPA